MYDDGLPSPILGPMLRAYQLYNLIQNTRNAGEDRKLALEDRDRRIANEQRAHESQDFQTRLGLQDMGAAPETDLLKRFTSILGSSSSHTAMKTPVGGYYIPTHETRQQNSLDDLMAKARAQSYGKLNEQQLLLPGQVEAEGKKATARETAKRQAQPVYKLLPEVADALGKTEATAAEIEAWAKQHNAGNPNLHIVTSTDDRGNVSATAINPKTFERVGTIALGQVGKSKSEPQAKPAQVFGKIKEFEEQRKRAQTLYNKADLFEQAGDQEKADAARKEAESQLQYATTLATTMAQAYPDQIEGGPGDADQSGRRWPYVKMRQGAPSGASPQAASGAKVFPASKLTDLAKRRKKDANAVRKELTAAGYQIDERN